MLVGVVRLAGIAGMFVSGRQLHQSRATRIEPLPEGLPARGSPQMGGDLITNLIEGRHDRPRAPSVRPGRRLGEAQRISCVVCGHLLIRDIHRSSDIGEHRPGRRCTPAWRRRHLPICSRAEVSGSTSSRVGASSSDSSRQGLVVDHPFGNHQLGEPATQLTPFAGSGAGSADARFPARNAASRSSISLIDTGFPATRAAQVTWFIAP